MIVASSRSRGGMNGIHEHDLRFSIMLVRSAKSVTAVTEDESDIFVITEMAIPSGEEERHISYYAAGIKFRNRKLK